MTDALSEEREHAQEHLDNATQLRQQKVEELGKQNEFQQQANSREAQAEGEKQKTEAAKAQAQADQPPLEKLQTVSDAAIERSTPPEDSPSVSQIKEIREAVFRLLRYAVSQANIKVENKFIESTTSVLRKKSSALTPEDEATLWKSYNDLSMLVHPATSESIWVAEQLEEERRSRAEGGDSRKKWPAAAECQRQIRRPSWALIVIVSVFILLQTYVIFLTDIMRDADQHKTAKDSVETQIAELRKARPNPINDDDLWTDPVFAPFMEKQKSLEFKIDATYYTLVNFSWPWRWLYEGQGIKSAQQEAEADKIVAAQKERIALEQGARSVLQVLTFYLLPLVLGLLGAIAFIVRRLLTSLEANSYMLNSGRRLGMRLALGALLGVISGIIFAPDQLQLKAFNLTLVTSAFLMGYSVEFAFSVFDALIERGRQAVKSDGVPDKRRETQQNQ